MAWGRAAEDGPQYSWLHELFGTKLVNTMFRPPASPALAAPEKAVVTVPSLGGNAGPVIGGNVVLVPVLVEVELVVALVDVVADPIVEVVVGMTQVPSVVGFFTSNAVVPLFDTCPSPGAKRTL